MRKWLGELDRILRGEATRLPELQRGTIEIPAAGLSLAITLLGMFYGLCMGCFAVVDGRAGGVLQMLASMIKVPALFFLTLVVTFPSLYVFNALVGSRLSILSLVRLLVAAMGVMLALLASFGTIVAFFSFTTESYNFMVLLNVVLFAVAGFLGLSFLLQTLHRLTIVQEPPPAVPMPVEPVTPGPEAPADEASPGHQDVAEAVTARRTTRTPGALEHDDSRAIGQNTRVVFRLWIILFGLVGAQMSWILRPFIGSGETFALFRPRGGNFFESVLNHLAHVLGAK